MLERHKRNKLNPLHWRKRGESEFTPITVTWVCKWLNISYLGSITPDQHSRVLSNWVLETMKHLDGSVFRVYVFLRVTQLNSLDKKHKFKTSLNILNIHDKPCYFPHSLAVSSVLGRSDTKEVNCQWSGLKAVS